MVLNVPRRSYLRLLSLSWDLNWRLLLSNVTLIPIVAMFAMAFGFNWKLWAAVYVVLDVFVAWPFVLRRALPPETFGLHKNEFRLRYWPSVLFGIVADVLSLPAAVLLPLVRLFIVVPLLLSYVARRPA